MLKISKVAAVWPLSTCLALAALSMHAEAAVLNVCKQGCKYSIIQSAVNAAASGDQISIAEGIYTENISIDGKTLVLAGAGSALTIVDGRAASPVFTLGSTAHPEKTWHHITLQDMTITNGISAVSNAGGGVLVQTGATLILRSSVVTGNHAEEEGGGVAISTPGGQTSEIVDSRIEANHAIPTRGTSFGGGVFVDRGSSLSIVDSEIRENSTGAGGGGLECFPGSQVQIQRTRFEGNSATGWFHLGEIGGTGGAIEADCSLSISDSTFTGNFAAAGGALNVFAYAGDPKVIVTITRTTISGNTAGDGQNDVNLEGAVISAANNTTQHTIEIALDHVYLSQNKNLDTQTEDDVLTAGQAKVVFTDTTIHDPVNSGCIGGSCGK
ncbi:MAG: right-handed parallel beta-helix repeat-containing protein [Sinobacteraceae bacterium]|nr:right-handed parallel beta-helix repeat-containing protein [Nevskiaceae bacterium]